MSLALLPGHGRRVIGHYRHSSIGVGQAASATAIQATASRSKSSALCKAFHKAELQSVDRRGGPKIAYVAGIIAASCSIAFQINLLPLKAAVEAARARGPRLRGTQRINAYLHPPDRVRTLKVGEQRKLMPGLPTFHQ